MAFSKLGARSKRKLSIHLLRPLCCDPGRSGAAALLGRVIGTAGTREKAEVARQAGAGDVILYREQDLVAEVKRLTDGKGVDVVYDGVGEATFLQSLDCLKPRGMMAAFGQSSGPIKPVLSKTDTSPLILTNIFQKSNQSVALSLAESTASPAASFTSL